MTAFNSGDKVLLHQGPGYVGTVHEAFGSGWHVNFGGTGDAWLVAASMTKLPADTPVLRHGDLVRVATDAPQHGGRYGAVSGAGFHGRLFGYWLNLDGPAERAWIPAEALTVLTAAKGRAR